MGLSKENLRGGVSFDLVTEPFVTLGDERKAVSMAQSQFIGGVASSSPLGAFLMPRAREGRTGASFAIFNVGSVPFLAAAAKDEAPFFELLDPGNLAPSEMFEAHIGLDANGQPKWVGSNSTFFAQVPARDLTRSLFIPGGDDGGANTTFQRYDPGKQAWSVLPNLPSGRQDATAAWSSQAGGQVMVASGSPGTVSAFNGAAWSALTAPTGSPTIEHSGGCVSVNRWSIADGSTSLGTWSYNVSGAVWTNSVSPASVLGGDYLTRGTAAKLTTEADAGFPQDRAVFTGRASGPLYHAAELRITSILWATATSRPGSTAEGMTGFYAKDHHGRGAGLFVGGTRAGLASPIREAYMYRETASGTGYWSEIQSLILDGGVSSAGGDHSESAQRGYLFGGDALSPPSPLVGAYSIAGDCWRTETSGSTAVRGITNGVAAGAIHVA